MPLTSNKVLAISHQSRLAKVLFGQSTVRVLGAISKAYSTYNTIMRSTTLKVKYICILGTLSIIRGAVV